MTHLRFRAPILQRMANGQDCILLTEEGTWESFAPFAETFAPQLGASIVERIDAAYMRMWTIVWEGERFHLVYEDHPNGIRIEPLVTTSTDHLHRLMELVESESAPDGL